MGYSYVLWERNKMHKRIIEMYYIKATYKK